jgi:hypothetical protein
MPRTVAVFGLRAGFDSATTVTAQDLYVRCRRGGGLFEGELADVDDWPRLIGALRRRAAKDGLSVSQFTQRERSFPHRPTRQVQVHKNGVLAYLP